MFPINRKIFLILVLAILLGSLPAFADMAVEVSVDSTVQSMKLKYKKNNEIGTLKDKLRQRLKDNLEGPPGGPPDWPELALWKFVLGDPGIVPKKGGAPQLQFVIFESRSLKNQIRLQMTYRSAEAKKSWDIVWIESGQLMAYGYPDDFEAAIDELFDLIHDQLLPTNKAELRQLFTESAPLASGGAWDGDSAMLRLVLPLPWDRFGSLSRSRFRLACSWPEKADKSPATGKALKSPVAGKAPPSAPKMTSSDEIELLSCGTGQSRPYSSNNRPVFQALSVIPRKWRASRWGNPQPIEGILSRARELRPLWTYLTEELPSLCSDLDMEVIQ